MTNERSHATFACSLVSGSDGVQAWGEKKSNTWRVSVSVINGKCTGMRAVEEVLKLGAREMNRSDDADHEVAETWKC